MKLRTLTSLPCIIGVVRDCWHLGSFSVFPLRRSWGNSPPNTFLMETCPDDRHIILLSRNWANALKQGLVVSCDEIGARFGLSGGRVRQIVRLSKLHPTITTFLAGLRGKENLKHFSEHRLRDVIALPRDQQVKRFQEGFSGKIGP